MTQSRTDTAKKRSLKPVVKKLRSKLGLAWHDQSIRLERCTILLGANGSGKTKLIGALHDALNEEKQRACTFTVWGGRQQATYSATVNPDATLPTVHDRLDPTDRFKQVLDAMASQDAKNERAYLRGRWSAHITGEEPFTPTSLLTEWARAVNRVLPHLHILPVYDDPEVDDGRAAIRAVQNDQRYDLPQASDGEREVAVLLGNVVYEVALRRQDELVVVMVDEPERSLHPHLADTLWSTIEGIFRNKLGDNCRFVYATHSVHFATRPCVDMTYFVDRENGLVPIGGISDLDRMAQQALLADLPNTTRALLLCEGGIDYDFYSWLLQGDRIGVVPVAGCAGVTRNIKNRTDQLRQWAGGVAGVVDGDVLLQSPVGDNLVQLDEHELESLLCRPDVVAALTSQVTESDVRQWLLGKTEDQLHELCKPKKGHPKLCEAALGVALRGAAKRQDLDQLYFLLDGKKLHDALVQDLKPGWSDVQVQLQMLIETPLGDRVPSLAKLRLRLRDALGHATPAR